MYFSLQLGVAILLDGVFGDPRWYPHPVRLIGALITFCEKFYRRRLVSNYAGGLLTVISVIGITGAVIYGLLFCSLLLNPFLESLVAIILLYTTIAARDLLIHSSRVQNALEHSTLEEARAEVGKVVGRDTGTLSSEQVTAACVETVAENMVDGITAPLFFAVLASPLSFFLPLSAISCAALGAFIYKAINTMDSMLGYKNEQYLEFGRCAARLDDLVNNIPARLSGLVLIAAAFLLGNNYRGAARTFFRDRLNHSSPNAAHPESAVAGALGIRLGGPSLYFGNIVEKQYIGDPVRSISPRDIYNTQRLVIVGTVFFVAALLFVRYVFVGTL